MPYQFQYSNQISLDWVVKHLKSFLFPDLSKKKNRIHKPFSGVIATLDKKPVGLILSTFGKTVKEARIHSFVVHPDHRNQGVGKKLLESLEQHLREEGCEKLEGTYRNHWKSVPALKAILEQTNWHEPEKELVIVRGEAKKVLRLFMDDRLTLPNGYAFAPFVKLSVADKEAIKTKKKQQDWYPEILDPFVHENSMNPVTSLALKFGDEVIGWVISHLIGPDLNEFTSLFIDASHRSYKLAHLLMRETIHRQHDQGINKFLITSTSDNYVMARFLIRHAPDTGVFFTTSYRTAKKLTR